MAVVIYPLLALVEHEKWYGRFFVQKSPGEIRRSLLMLFFMFAAVIAAAWGIFGNPHIAAASILMWGMGDASAAAELFSPSEWDTVTVPVAVLIVLMPAAIWHQYLQRMTTLSGLRQWKSPCTGHLGLV